MNRQALSMVVLALLFTGIGLGSGWYAGGQRTHGGGGEAGPGAEGEHAEGRGPKGHDQGLHKPVLSPQALKNLGVTLTEAETTTFWKHQAVTAVVAEGPLSLQPLYAPIGGRIIEVKALPGDLVPGGGLVVTLVRDALPRPVLSFTDQILKPANEDFHRALGEARKAKRGMEIFKTELERLQKFTDTGAPDALPVLPKKGLIDLRYEILKAEIDLQNAEGELRRHGSTDEQVAGIFEGRTVPVLGRQLWKQALQQNGMWPPAAEELAAALPAPIRDLPWSVAAIGELVAAGLPVADLTAWFKAESEAGSHFLEIAGMLQQGHSLTTIQNTHQAGGLEQIVRIRAPKVKEVPDWDLATLDVKPGQRVETGQPVASLANPRQLLLRSEPVGGEVAAMLKALSLDSEIEAGPLVAETGPLLRGLKIAYITSDPDGHGTVAVLRVENEVFSSGAGTPKGQARTWRLRNGLRYLLKLPTEKMEEVFKLASDAVTEDGPDKVVFIQDGESFKAAKVVVRYQDHEFAVLDAKHSELFPGDTVVQHGAFGLGLALKAGSGAVDPHAGHNH